MPLRNCIIFGFDSAWTAGRSGAICAIGYDRAGKADFIPPRSVDFLEAIQFIGTHRRGYAVCLVALDQPTIVPNASGCRPVERVAGSVISYAGGGVQPSNTGKAAMFGVGAPIWNFKSRLAAIDDPFQARTARKGVFLTEVYPALALSGLHTAFSARKGAPKYNPANTGKFRIGDWAAVCACVATVAGIAGPAGMKAWASRAARIAQPRKADQDRLDAVICALVGVLWRSGTTSDLRCIGDVLNGYMLTPVSVATDARLAASAVRRGVPYQ